MLCDSLHDLKTKELGQSEGIRDIRRPSQASSLGREWWI